MKKFLFLLASLTFAISSHSQTPTDKNIDWNEDEVVSIDDIMNDKRVATSASFSTSHFKKVWRRKTYVDLGMNSSKLTPTSSGNKYESTWGATFQNGRSFGLHRPPISQVLLFSLDWSWLDVMFNKYDATSAPSYLISDWDSEKYEFHAGMNIGPSITLAPFTHIQGTKGLHHLKFNAYFHVGYAGAFVFLNEEDGFDTDMAQFGHGMATSFGASMNWKALGIGFEKRNAKRLKFKPYSDGDDNLDRKFDASTTRIFIQFRI